MIRKRSFIYFTLGFLGIFLVSCSHHPKNAKTNYHYLKAEKSLSDRGKSIYYYLVSQVEDIAGKEEFSNLYLDKSIQKNPSSAFLLVRKAYSLARENKLKEAKEIGLKALKTHPNDVSVLLLLGKINTSIRQSDAAIDYYKQVIGKDFKNEEAYNLLAQEYLLQDKTKEAIEALKKIIQYYPESIGAHYYLGSIYATQIKDLNKALQIYENILNIFPNDQRAMRLVAEIHLAKKDYNQALKLFDELTINNPSDLSLKIKTALLHYELKNLEQAILIFQDILESNPRSDRIHYYLGLLYLELKAYDKSLDHLNQVPPQSSFYADSVGSKALVFKKTKQPQKAIEMAKTNIQKYPDHPEYYSLLVNIYLGEEKHDEAMQAIDDGLKKIPQNEELLFSKGVIYDKMGETKKSLEIMEEVLKLNDKNALALNFIGYSLAEKGEELNRAQELIEKAFSIKPNDGYIADSLGWVYFQKGQIEKALSFLEKANFLSPNVPTILIHLGEVYQKMGNRKKARTYFEQALFEMEKNTNKNKKDEEELLKIREKLGQL
ncbi:MAG: hypothetical protein A3G32_06270 [Deltaproteobacteria bacterium RIFCSPLOWO2_12_FULL_40_28]|nr:MAG: hypothetical protein A3C45_02365 [Deltaproteobacteria bacterium RIFCSPHIGHO2_02_FULL_40_28]OGQ19060.1 MAG: hypothetical protein A3E27_05455 [Deltaproteobacteria bacterium RIFCSPHIGHO2_12_FULL_40_32]OGQ40232.1 MAG: hypothetical protein A3I69_00895 [Deltaproteobacteria bacterium RIFCSPLOWO2_02_FULL_40_36]OGQ53503.1 MAG: hypothetical protein A3G32_06270 [Deltaproteobacteria bacterium RIFCSPLOWO2_12_FULL_40_28]